MLGEAGAALDEPGGFASRLAAFVGSWLSLQVELALRPESVLAFNWGWTLAHDAQLEIVRAAADAERTQMRAIVLLVLLAANAQGRASRVAALRGDVGPCLVALCRQRALLDAAKALFAETEPGPLRCLPKNMDCASRLSEQGRP